LVRDKRPFDEPAELLFRTLNAETHLDGDVLLLEAIDVVATSCSRQRFCETPEKALERSPRKHDDAVAAVGVGGLPQGPHTAPGGSVWEFYLEDLPEESNDAHCEIRYRHPGEAGPNRVKRGSAKDFVRQTLARAFRVVHRA
jgi:hypothetical protein